MPDMQSMAHRASLSSDQGKEDAEEEEKGARLGA